MSIMSRCIIYLDKMMKALPNTNFRLEAKVNRELINSSLIISSVINYQVSVEVSCITPPNFDTGTNFLTDGKLSLCKKIARWRKLTNFWCYLYVKYILNAICICLFKYTHFLKRGCKHFFFYSFIRGFFLYSSFNFLN